MKTSLPLRTRQRGVGIVTAIFLLVVLAGLGVAMVSLVTSQQAGANLDLQGARAYQAARAGLEWGLYQQLRNKSCAASTAVAMPAGTSLSTFTVVVSCVTGGAASLPAYTITSVACNIPDSGGGCAVSNKPESVRRTLEVQL